MKYKMASGSELKHLIGICTGALRSVQRLQYPTLLWKDALRSHLNPKCFCQQELSERRSPMGRRELNAVGHCGQGPSLGTFLRRGDTLKHRLSQLRGLPGLGEQIARRRLR